MRNVRPQLDFLRDPVELVTLGVPQIVSNLQAQPPTGVAAEVAGEAQCRIGRSARPYAYPAGCCYSSRSPGPTFM